VYRVRFHGRGGQGVKTASRILGSALFAEGFEVQDAPRYGAERRGAPLFATVRAGREPISERGPVRRPDLVVVADETLVAVAAAGVLEGLTQQSVLLICGSPDAEAWRARLSLEGPIFTLPPEAADARALQFVGALCAGGAARLLGVVSREALESAVREELAGAPEPAVARSVERALSAYDALAPAEGRVVEQPAPDASAPAAPDWIELPFEEARISAPDIHGALTSVQVRTGLWRTLRPVIDRELCRRCHWVCGSLCPDGAISVDADGAPRIDLDHCKGCMVCMAVCPPHAIHAVPEATADDAPEEVAS
jgi:pyruvate ferredoxin oxidoreductase gamma subunit